MNNFEYSKEFVEAVNRVHEGKENLPSYDDYIAAHLGGPDSRISQFITNDIPEIEYHCGPLENKTVLDFGAGTGAITAGLAMHCRHVVAFDIDKPSLDLCALRLKEHGLSDKVSIVHAPDFSTVADKIGSFDLVMMYAVIEHIPISKTGLRRDLVRLAFENLASNGHLYVNETPNRLWPRDIHTTGMWFIPWMRAGSALAYKRAIAAGRHVDYDGAPHSPGPLGLEERGAWGMTYREFKSMLPKNKYQIVNTLPNHDQHVKYTRKHMSTKRRMFEKIVYCTITKPLGIPIVALAPMFSPIVVKKL